MLIVPNQDKECANFLKNTLDNNKQKLSFEIECKPIVEGKL
jgi:hypothetical protein